MQEEERVKEDERVEKDEWGGGGELGDRSTKRSQTTCHMCDQGMCDQGQTIQEDCEQGFGLLMVLYGL